MLVHANSRKSMLLGVDLSTCRNPRKELVWNVSNAFNLLMENVVGLKEPNNSGNHS